MRSSASSSVAGRPSAPTHSHAGQRLARRGGEEPLEQGEIGDGDGDQPAGGQHRQPGDVGGREAVAPDERRTARRLDDAEDLAEPNLEQREQREVQYRGQQAAFPGSRGGGDVAWDAVGGLPHAAHRGRTPSIPHTRRPLAGAASIQPTRAERKSGRTGAGAPRRYTHRASAAPWGSVSALAYDAAAWNGWTSAAVEADGGRASESNAFYNCVLRGRVSSTTICRCPNRRCEAKVV